MEGVTTAIVGFLLVCLVFPTMVKNKPQYYCAFAAVLFIILLWGLQAVIRREAFIALCVFMTAAAQIFALILLILCVGGLTLRQLTSEVTEAIEVIRRGETQKEVIIPIRGEVPVQEKHETPPPPIKISDSDSSIPVDE